MQTVLENLFRKGWLNRSRDGRAYCYVTVRSREEYVAGLLGEALAAARDPAATLVRLVEDLDPAEVAQLRAALERRGGRITAVTMMVPGLLAAYALAVAAAGTWWLPRASWPRRLPRLGIAAWQVLTVTFVASVLLAAMLVAIPCLPDGVNLDAAAELRDHYSSARGIVIGSTAAVASLAAIGRLLWATVAAMTWPGAAGPGTTRPWPWSGGPGRSRAWWSSTTTAPWCTACPAGTAWWSPPGRSTRLDRAQTPGRPGP